MAIPVTLDDAKRQLRIDLDDTSQDEEIEGFIADAAAWVERYTGHILAAREVEQTFADFSRLRLTGWPVKPDASVSIGYMPLGSAATNLYGPRIASHQRPAAVLPPLGKVWPSPVESVVVLYRAGYEDADAVPGNFRRAMLVLIGAYARDREGGEIMQKAEATAKSLCADYRARAL